MVGVAELRVNGLRLRESIEAMAALGATEGGGCHRLALTDEDRRARDLLVRWLRELGLGVRVDEMGNIMGFRPGRDEGLAPVMMGSHLDTQPFGGRFDGVLGVMAGLEVMRTLEENRIQTLRPIVLCNWTNEEGSRFAPAVMGSGVWSGNMALEEVYSSADKTGRTVRGELSRIGYLGREPARAFPLHSYWELHVEQGPVLDSMGVPIGVPLGIYSIWWYDVTVEGESNQVGPTPMDGRRDALCAAAEMILAVERVALELGGGLVATVGRIENHPNSPNIIPGRARFTVDIRSWEDSKALLAWEKMMGLFHDVAHRRGCTVTARRLWATGHVEFHPRLVQKVKDNANKLGYQFHEMLSGAGHDAGYLSRIAPTAMIFVPSIRGRSHVEQEETSWEDCEKGANVLLHCVLESSMEV